MTPSMRRSILAVASIGGCLPAMAALAQQSPPSAQPGAAARPAAAKPASKKQAEKADPAAAQAEVENGVNALAQGRFDAAVASLTSALSASSLPQNQTARALYYRGVAYRRQAKPAQAISDLTNALWIKGGLTDEQRQDALQQRSGAYREAGLPDQSDPGGQRAALAAKGGSPSAPFAAVAPPAPSGSSTTMSAAGTGFFGSLFGGSSPPPQPAPANSAPATTASVAPRVAPPQPAAARPPAQPTVSGQPSGAAGQLDKPATRLVPVLNPASTLPSGFQDIAEPTRMVEVSTTARAGQPDPAGATGVAPGPDASPRSAGGGLPAPVGRKQRRLRQRHCRSRRIKPRNRSRRPRRLSRRPRQPGRPAAAPCPHRVQGRPASVSRSRQCARLRKRRACRRSCRRSSSVSSAVGRRSSIRLLRAISAISIGCRSDRSPRAAKPRNCARNSSWAAWIAASSASDELRPFGRRPIK